MTQFPETVSQIMMGNRTLKIAYQSLLTTSTATIAFALFIIGNTVTTTGFEVPLLVWILVAVGLTHLIPYKYGVFGIGGGAIAFGVHAFSSPSPIPVIVMFPAAIISACLTFIAMVFLTKHAVIIAALLWDKEMNGEIPDPDPSPEQGSDKEATGPDAP
jgi:hypothetical protein